MDVGNDERNLLRSREDDARPKINRQCTMWMLKNNPCSWEDINCDFLMSLGSLASEWKNTMSISNEPQCCVRVKRYWYKCFWYDDRRALDGEQVEAAYIIMVWDCVDDDLQCVLGSGVRPLERLWVL